MELNSVKMIKNKKADIPVMILVIGVVGICILTILSFVKFNTDVDKDFLGIGLIETINSISEEVDFIKENPEFEFEYGKNFVSGNVKIDINEKNIEGSYVEDEKTFVWIRYGK